MNQKKFDESDQAPETAINQQNPLNLRGHAMTQKGSTKAPTNSSSSWTTVIEKFKEVRYLRLDEYAKRASGFAVRVQRCLDSDATRDSLDLRELTEQYNQFKEALRRPELLGLDQELHFHDSWNVDVSSQDETRPNGQYCDELSTHLTEHSRRLVEEMSDTLDTLAEYLGLSRKEDAIFEKETGELNKLVRKLIQLAKDSDEMFNSARDHVSELLSAGISQRSFPTPYLGIELDKLRREMSRNGHSCDFSKLDRAWKIVAYLCDHGGAGVKASDLFESVWPNQAVVLNNLDQQKKRADERLSVLGLEIVAERGWWTIKPVQSH